MRRSAVVRKKAAGAQKKGIPPSVALANDGVNVLEVVDVEKGSGTAAVPVAVASAVQKSTPLPVVVAIPLGKETPAGVRSVPTPLSAVPLVLSKDPATVNEEVLVVSDAEQPPPPKRQAPLKKNDELLTILFSTAIGLGLPGVYFKGQMLEGQHGQKGKLMKQLRSQLEQHPLYKGRVPREDVLTLWLNDTIEERLREGPNKDHTGDGDGAGGQNPGVTTDTPLRDEVDSYILLSKAAMREGKRAKDTIDLQEKLGQVIASTHSSSLLCMLASPRLVQHPLPCVRFRLLFSKLFVVSEVRKSISSARACSSRCTTTRSRFSSPTSPRRTRTAVRTSAAHRS